jgi:hypothetical protein
VSTQARVGGQELCADHGGAVVAKPALESGGSDRPEPDPQPCVDWSGVGTPTPLVVAGPGHAQDSAHEGNPYIEIASLLRPDVSVHGYGYFRRARKASAFPKISSSSSLAASCPSSLRIFALSGSSSAASPLRTAPSCCCLALTQFEIEVAERLNSWLDRQTSGPAGSAPQSGP